MKLLEPQKFPAKHNSCAFLSGSTLSVLSHHSMLKIPIIPSTQTAKVLKFSKCNCICCSLLFHLNCSNNHFTCPCGIGVGCMKSPLVISIFSNCVSSGNPISSSSSNWLYFKFALNTSLYP